MFSEYCRSFSNNAAPVCYWLPAGQLSEGSLIDQVEGGFGSVLFEFDVTHPALNRVRVPDNLLFIRKVIVLLT